MPHSRSRVLVHAATGNQGSACVEQLLARGHQVHALSRDTSSPKSQSLKSAGARLFQGSFDDLESIRVAAQGCSVMILVIPYSSSEVGHARNALNAGRASQIEKCIYSSVANCETIIQRADFDPHAPRASYFLNKASIQNLVMSQFPSWTILQPAALMTDMVDPLARVYFPDLGGQHSLRGPWKPDTKFGWVDPKDIGKFAVGAVETDLLANKIVSLVGDPLTVPEQSEVMSLVSGQIITSEYIGDEVVASQKDQNPVFASAEWSNNGWFGVDKSSTMGLDMEFNTVEQFLTRQKESGTLDRTLRAQSPA